jgi:hypothetical protein
VQETQGEVKTASRVKENASAATLRYTNFYPRYGSADDQVDPVIAVVPVRFQRTEPRYRLSTSETRNQGVGPAFIEVPSAPGAGEFAGSAASTGIERRAAATVASPHLLEPWKGRQVDLYA